jgi:hypothetical protein
VHNGDAPSGNAVEQRRLSDVGPPYDGNETGHNLALAKPIKGAAEQVFHVAFHDVLNLFGRRAPADFRKSDSHRRHKI